MAIDHASSSKLYRVTNDGQAGAPLNLVGIRAYALGGSIKVLTSVSPNPDANADAFLAVRESEIALRLELLDRMTATDVVVESAEPDKTPWPKPAVESARPTWTLPSLVDAAGREGSPAAPNGAEDPSGYRVYAITDLNGDDDLTPTLRLANRAAFVWQARLAVLPGESLWVVTNEEAKLLQATKAAGLSLTELPLASATAPAAPLLEPNFNPAYFPFSAGADEGRGAARGARSGRSRSLFSRFRADLRSGQSKAGSAPP